MLLRSSLIIGLMLCHITAYLQIGLPLKPFNQNFYWYNQPLSFEIGDRGLTVVAGASTDMFRDPGVTYNTDTAPKLMTVVKGDFVVSTGVSHDFVSKWDGGALVLMADSFHWVKFCFEKDYLSKNRIVSVVTREVSDDCNSEFIGGNRVYLKVARKGKVVTLYFSEDRQAWTLVRHLQLNWPEELKLGFLAQSPTGENCKVKFEDIEFEYKSISDPYLGK